MAPPPIPLIEVIIPMKNPKKIINRIPINVMVDNSASDSIILLSFSH